MARKSATKGGDYTIKLGRPNSKPQRDYFASRTDYTCFGGARGGGKTWCTRTKVIGGVLEYPGIKMLVVRRTYEDLENSIIDPILAALPDGMYDYNVSKHFLRLDNGSTVKFGNMDGYKAAVNGKYQGQEFDWIFIEEATQFTEQEFLGIDACRRGASEFPKRMYLTANPGGVGHAWVKRLFISKEYEDDENPEDYTFIKATVEDNVDLIKNSPSYVKQLERLPPDIMRAHRYGDWDALAGGYFPEFRRKTHVVKDFPIPAEWAKYRAFDYGLDMFACLWIAVDFKGRHYVYREFSESDLLPSTAALSALSATPASERIEYTIAPPDMWSRTKDTGKTIAQGFMENGLGIIKANNSRVAGWLAVKEMLKPLDEDGPELVVFESCKGLINCLQAIQHDEKNPDDCATQPHEITHLPDALRYYCQLRNMKPEKAQVEEDYDLPNRLEEYDDYMCGGDASDDYINY